MVDRPVLQYIVEEAAAAGIGDVLLVTGRGKTSMVDHFDRQPYLESAPRGQGRLRAPGRRATPERTRRDLYLPAGPNRSASGHAVSYAESHVGNEPFVVLLGDEFVE